VLASDLRPDPRALQLQMMGGFRVVAGDREIDSSVWKLRKAAAIVKLLALDPTRQLHHEQLMEWLWPDVDSDAASNNLRRTLHVARRILSPAGEERAHWLQRHGDILTLGPRELVTTDVDAFESALQSIRSSDDLTLHRQAIGLYTGDLLPEDRYEEWAEGRRASLRASYMNALARMARLCEQAGQIDEALEELQQLVALDPAHEEAHVALMRLYAQDGQRRRALGQYQRLRDALQRELDIEPAASSQLLYQQILSGQMPDAPIRIRSGKPPSTGLDRAAQPPTNLPAQVTSFVGRAEQLTDLARLLDPDADGERRDGTVTRRRMVTLTGAGGSGKTRMAIEAAARLLRAFPGGVWMVELASLRDRSLLPLHILASVPPARNEPNHDPLQTLTRWFHGRRSLLILDNCEHLIDACADITESLAQACPDLTILATSREALRIPGETLWPIPPLAVPAAGQRVTPASLLELDGPRLFVDRAQAAQPRFRMTDASAPLVAEISRKLAGLPLAIELAATRVRVLSLEQIDARLNDALRLLTEGSRTAPERQHSLRATLDWSYDLLTEPERMLLRQLAVFAGGCQIDAIETVCAGDELPADVLDLLAHLVDKSLIEVDESGSEARYRLLEPVRQYAAQRLAAAGETEPTHERHAEWLLGYAERIRARWRATADAQRADMARLILELDNVRLVLARSLVRTGDVEVDHRRRELGTRLLVALHYFWQDGYMTEACGWLERYVEADDDARLERALRFRMLHALGMFWRRLGNFERATVAAERLMAETRGLGDPALLDQPLYSLGGVARDRGDYLQAIACYEEWLVSSRERDDIWQIVSSLAELADTHNRLGAYGRAVETAAEGVAICRARQPGPARLAELLAELAHAQLGMGDLTAARASVEESLGVCREMNWLWGAALALTKLGRVAHAQGDLDWAEAAWLESLTLFQTLGERPRVALCFEGVSRLAVARGQPERSAIMLGAAGALRNELGAPSFPSDRAAIDACRLNARTALAQAQWEQFDRQGRTMTTTEVVAFALQSADV
jgi:predicted ATPase/DNA-binding SARP family transcriptional activator